MRVISKARLRAFWEQPGREDAREPLLAWHKIAKDAAWHDWGEVRAIFAKASLVGNCIVFNIRANHYRMVTRIIYAKQRVYILKVMSHAEYDDQGKWQEECGCHKPPPQKEKVTMRTRTTTRAIGASYFALVKKFPLVPIRDDEHLVQASALIDELLTRQLDRGESAYLEVISDLVCRYEDQHHPLPDVSQAAMLRYLLEEKGISQAHLAREAGISPSVISEVMSGVRELSKANIKALARYFGVSPSSFLFQDDQARPVTELWEPCKKGELKK